MQRYRHINHQILWMNMICKLYRHLILCNNCKSHEICMDHTLPFFAYKPIYPYFPGLFTGTAMIVRLFQCQKQNWRMRVSRCGVSTKDWSCNHNKTKHDQTLYIVIGRTCIYFHTGWIYNLPSYNQTTKSHIGFYVTSIHFNITGYNEILATSVWLNGHFIFTWT